MKLLAEKKINPIVSAVALYLSFCAAGFYFSRGDWAFAASVLMGLSGMGFITNPIVAFFGGGIISYAFYEVCTAFVFRNLRPRIGWQADSMKYELRFFYTAANCTAALLSLFYLISPIISIYGGVFVPFVSQTVFAALYIVYAFKRHIEKGRWGATLIGLGGTYLAIYAFLTAIKIFGVA